MKPLTPRQLDVLRLAADGWTAAEAGERLDITLHTVRQHREAALRRLRAHTMAQAVAISLRRGLIA